MEPGCVICIPVFQSISCFPGCASVADASRKTPEAIATSGLPGFSKSQVTAGFEPAIRELQSHALPLGYVTTLKPCGAVKNCPTDARIRSADFSPTHRAQPSNEESLCDSECGTACAGSWRDSAIRIAPQGRIPYDISAWMRKSAGFPSAPRHLPPQKKL